MIREFNNPELAPRNSFHVAQRAARLIEFDRTEDLQELFEKGMPDPLVRPRRRQQRPLHARLSRYAADPCGTGYPHRGRTAGLRDGRSRRGRRVGRPGRMGRTARTVGIGKPLAHPRQSRGRSGSEYRGLRLRGQGCDPKRRDVLHGDLQHARPEQRTLRVRVPGQRLQTLPAGTCNHHLGPLCVEPHAPAPTRIRGFGRSGRSAGRHHAAQHPRGRLCDPPGQAARPCGDGQRRELLQESGRRPRGGRTLVGTLSRYAALSGSRPFASPSWPQAG